jgi:hypothetical protein
MVPLLATAAGSAGLLERVPTLPATLAEAQSGFAGLQAQADALRRDIDAAQNELDAAAETSAAADEERARQQASDLEAMTGMSAEEMAAADEEEVADKMLEGFGMSMADMEAVAEMDDAEAEAYFASKQANAKPSNTEGLQKLAGNAPSGADAEKLDRLSREFGDWSAQNADHTMRASEEYQALGKRWADDHAQLNARLDADLAPRVKSVPVVDCGEAGEYADAVATHAIAVERAAAHAALAPGHLRQGADFLARRREAVRADASFADRFAADAQGVDMMSGQSIAVQSQALLRIEELLNQTVEITQQLLSWDGEKGRLESIRPKSSCG